mmetsp:Transcript_7412/g.30858  ORF Transcript_7412/g.30858 Transcript_7412/m.30858 type:complete len:227 (-) Transcript_7412:1599-2279(-)
MSCGTARPSAPKSRLSIKSPAVTSRALKVARLCSSTVIQCAPQFTGSETSSPFPEALGTSAAPNELTASNRASPGTSLFMERRQGVPRTAPDASVSPCPSASSAYATFASPVIGCLVINMNETSGTSICCASTAIAASLWPTPAAARDPTARVVNSDAHTSATAPPSVSKSCGSTLETESYKPAADKPARSSAFPVERTMMRDPRGNSALSCSSASREGRVARAKD